MAIFNPSKTITWSRTTPADGDLIDDEVDRLYSNDQYLKDRIDQTDSNLTTARIPLGGIVEDNLDQCSSALFKEANAQAISRTSFSALWNLIHKTITSMTPATDRVNVTAHGCVEGQLVKFAFTGGGVTALTKYYVRNPTTNDFQISTTASGTIVDLTASQTGDMITNVEYGFGDGSTTYNVPDRRGIFARGAGQHGNRAKALGGNYDGGATGFEGQDQFQRFLISTKQILNDSFNSGTYGYNAIWLGGYEDLTPKNDPAGGAVRLGTETTPAYIAVKYKVRVA
ncbi:hypothetical protein [Leptospira kmetyi]|uniref:Phage tail protein n=1 Tax=Leptospira kmetyi TaxID=408139 RepID=A0ABX4NEB9_9LEPT|nr:hypothetical protein [Leptospira kmetyi]EQA52326.1 hypothetical protein LEP1GSC052_1973 [Leptospira kmetyi serovar Malaysia str. Bejo-Iso9]PJZ31686.1 hypothetical protein CH378_00265 [Leptospira kmetyi]